VAAGLFPQDWAGEFEPLGEFGEAQAALRLSNLGVWPGTGRSSFQR
jgi:hypothetical protein